MERERTARVQRKHKREARREFVESLEKSARKSAMSSASRVLDPAGLSLPWRSWCVALGSVAARKIFCKNRWLVRHQTAHDPKFRKEFCETRRSGVYKLSYK